MSRRISRTSFAFAVALCIAGVMVSLSGRQAQPATTWQVVGSLLEARDGAAAAPLGNGVVLVAGGRTSQGVTAVVEAVNAAAGSSTLASLRVARADHSATRLNDGRVLVAGGTGANGRALSNAEIFDPSSGAWTTVKMDQARAHHTATRLDDGRVVVAGGDDRGAATASIEVFDPVTNAFSPFAHPLLKARTRAAASVLPGGRVLVAGGSAGAATLATTEIVDLTKGTVTAGPAMSTPRANFTATALLDHDVLLAGGTDGKSDLASAERFDAAAGTLGVVGGLSGARQGHTAVRLPENSGVLIVGGTSGGQGLLGTELFLPESAYFQASGVTNATHVGGVASETTTSGVAIAAGGQGTAAVERYRFATVLTDKKDYAPGTTVTITGSGWVPGEQVLLHLKESPDFDEHPLLSVIADSRGNIVSNEFSPDRHDIGINFYLTAYGSQSEAQTVFADAADGNGTMTVSPSLALGGTTGNTFTFTFTNTAATAFSAGSLVTVAIPSGGWSPAQTTPGTPGLVTVNAGSCAGVSLTSVTSTLITVAQTCAPGASFTITYDNVTTPAAAAYTFTTQSADGPTGATNIASQPVVTVAATHLVVTAVNGGANPTAGTAFSVTIQNQNPAGTPVNVTAATGVGLSRTAGSGTLGGTTAGTIANGTSSVTISGVTYTKAEGGVVLTAARTSGNTVTSGDSAAFTVNAGAATKLAVTSVNGGGAVTAGTAFPVVVQSQDANGNASNVTADTAFSLSRASGTGALSGTLTGTIASGGNVVTVSGVTYIKAESGVTITATRTSGNTLTAGTSAAFVVSPAVVDHLAFSAQPASTVAVATINGAGGVKVDVRDVFENVITTDTRSVTLAIGTNPGGGTLGGTTTVAAVAGVATFSTLNIDKAGTGYTLAASSSPALTTPASAAFNITVGAPSKLVVASVNGGANVVAGTAFAVVVQSQDAGGNLANQTGATNITLSRGAGTGTLGGTLTGVIANNTSSVTISGVTYTKAESGVTITATRTSGGTAVTPGTSAPFTVDLGAAHHLTFSTAPTNTVATAPINAAGGVVVQVRDAGDNLLPSDTRTITLAIGTNPGAGTLSGTATAAAVGGVATFTGLSINKVGTGYTLAATSSPALTGATSAAFNITAGAVTQLAITAINGGSNPVAGTAFSVVVQSQDAGGNAVTVPAATGVTLSLKTGTGTLGGTLTGSIASGASSATISGVTYTRAEGGVVLTATRTSGATLTAGDSAAFTVNPGAPTKLVVASVNGGSSPVAGTAFSVVVQAQDANNNLANVTSTTGFTLSRGTGTGALGGTLTGSFATGTNAVTMSGLTYPKAESGVTIVATRTSGNALTTGTSAAFTVIPGAADHLTFSVAPTTTVAAGAINGAGGVKVEIRDASNNLITGDTRSVTLAIGTNPGGGTLSGTASVAAAGGVATFTGLNIDRPGTGYTLAATSTPALTGATSAAFNITLGPASRLAITAVNGGNTPAAGTAFSIVVQSQDAAGNAANVTAATGVSLSLAAGNGTLGGTLTGSIASGASAVTISGVTYTRAESGVVVSVARTSGNTLTQGNSAPFTVGPGAADHLAFKVQPASAAANVPMAALTVEVRDVNNNVVSGDTRSVSVGLGANPGNGTLAGTTTVSAVSGVATFTTLSLNNLGTGYTLSASSSPALTGATSAAFNITARATSTAVVCAPSGVSLNHATTCTASVTDLPAAPSLPAGTVTFSSDGSGTFSTGGSCTLGSTATAPNTTSCSVTYTPTSHGTGTHGIGSAFAANAPWAASSATPFALAIVTASQAITVTTAAPASAVFGQTFPVAATADSGLTVAITTTGSCHVSAGGPGSATIAIDSGTGACTVHYNQAGSLDFDPAEEATNVTNAGHASQSITFGALPDRAFGDADFAPGATASSGLTVSYTTSGTCAVTGTTAHLTGVGACTITAHQAGDGNYDPAADVAQSFTVGIGTATVAWSDPAGISFGTALGATQLNATTNSDGAVTFAPAAGTVLSVGTHTLHVDVAATANYVAASKDVTIVVVKATPTITWSNPAAITYGTALGATELNATTSGDGALTYTPAAGTVLGGGTRTLHVDAAETASYNAAGKDVTIIVNPATQTITWADPAAITYGAALGAAELNATTSGDGALTYSPAAGTVLGGGAHTLHVDAAATANYLAAGKDVTITVNRATPTITWSDPAAIGYSTPLGPTQLNATTSSDGALTYTPAAGTILGIGTQTLHVDAAATTNFTAAGKDVTIVVGKGTPVVAWTNPATITFGTALGAAQLNATTSSDGALTYTPTAGAVLGAGTQTLHVDVAETASYFAASKDVTLVVGKATPTITWADPGSIVYGTPLGATELNATTSGDGALTYTPAAGAVLGGGSRTLHVDAAATANYNAAAKDVTILVTPATPTIGWTDPAAIIYGTALGATQLNATTTSDGALTYTPAAGTVLGGGSHTLHVDAAATANYVAAARDVTITINRATPAIVWSDPVAIAFGTPLSSAQLNATTTSDGTLTYTPAAGTILGVGTQTLHVDAAATANFNAAGTDVTLVVGRGTPTIAWSDPAAITFGTALGAIQLNATTNSDGALTFTPAAGTVLGAGTYTLHVDVAATATYTAASRDVTLLVGKAAPAITWNNPAPIVVGTPLGAVQLNATTTGDGALTYTPAAGAVLGGGAQTLHVDEAATANFLAASQDVTIFVNRIPQTIVWTNPVGITIGTALGAAQLNATTTSDGVLTYTPAAGTILGLGTHTLHVDAAQTSTYLAASKDVFIAVGAASGGILESATSTSTRARLTPADLQAFLPERGQFTFPAPYGTTGVRLTNQHDCGEWYDCVNTPTGGSWRNMNNSAGSNLLYVVLGMDKSNAGVGPSLFRYNKTTGETVNLGGLFDPDDDRTWGSLDGWYFSPSLPTKFYVGLDQRLSRYDILTRQTETVFDTTATFGDDKEVYHAQSSNDDRVHSFTLRLVNNYEPLGCGVYREDTHQFSYYPSVGLLHECQVDKSGQWLLIKEDRDNSGGEDNRIVNIYTGAETVLLRTAGAAGSSDNGFGTMLAVDATAALPGAIRAWAFGPLAPGAIVYHSLDGLPPSFTQISFANARSAALDQQYACGGVANRDNGPRANEIACVRLDGSTTTLTIAPTMTDLDALGGGPDDDLIKQPWGNLDPTGEYFLWTTNLLGDRIDAFLVRVPSQQLVTVPADLTAPVVAIAAPADASTVNGSTVLSATATDDTGVAGVQFQLDGVNLGAELTTAPFTWSWDTTTAADGVHILTAIARDAAGNFTLSLPVAVTVLNTPDVPQISGVTATGVIERLATVRWVTSQLADSIVEYGPTTAYGSSTTLDPTLTAAHLQTLVGLTQGTAYHYRVTSKNAQGGSRTSPDFTFTTLAAPAISAIGVSAITPSSVTVSWTTDIPSDTLVEYGVTTGYGDATNTAEAFVTSHVQGVYDLQPGTTYHYRVYSVTPQGVLTVSSDFTFTTVGAPAVSGVGASDITRTAATVGWTTDQASNSEVEYGLTTAYGSTTGADGSFVTTHARTLTGLTESSTYHYRVSSHNVYGLTTTSDDFTFRTLDPPAAVISAVSASALTGTSATIGWSTDQAADSQVEYGLTASYGATTTLDPALVTTHGQALTGLNIGTAYHYRVISTNTTGQVATSSDFTFTTVAPPVISGTGATNVTNTSATVVWTTDQAATSRVEYGLDTTYGSATALDPALVTTHSQLVGGLTPSTTYHYRVTSTNGVGLTTTSADGTFTAVATPVISGLTASSITGTAATIAWTTDQATDARVDYGTTSAYGSSTALDPALASTHSQTIVGLTIGTTYHYRVTSTNAFGMAASSADATFATVALPEITGVNASPILDTSATIGWTTAPAGDSRVEYGLTTAYGSSTALDTALVTAHGQTIPGLTAGTTYHYRVISTNVAGQATSADFTLTTITRPVIFGVAASGNAGTTATLTWTTDQAASSQVEYGLTTAYGSSTTLNGTLVTSHSQSMTGLAAGTTYHFRVRSTNGAGLLATSGDFTITTVAPPAIFNVAVSDITGIAATVTWNTNQMADRQVEYGLTTAYGSATAVESDLDTSHNLSILGLAAGTTYHYRVRSTNSVGLLAVSADATFTTPVMRSILVVSPHPDDDLITAGGITATAVSQGAPVTIAYMTNGDACCTPQGVSLGLLREGEAVNGQAILGVAESNLLFLGYPDSYLTTMYLNHPNADQVLTTSWGQSTTYANRGLGATDWHSYKFGAPANYNGANAVQDLTSILQTYRPDDIYTTAEFDVHADHSTTYAMLKQAIAAATAADPTYMPVLHKTVVHTGTAWPAAANPTTPFTDPGIETGVTWAGREDVVVPAAMQNPDLSVNPKARAISTHVSQGGLASLLSQFLHSDEFFWTELGANPTPVLSVTPGPAAFGTRPVGATASLTITIANVGTGPLTLAAPVLPAAPFDVSGLPAIGTVLAAGGSVTATVTFTPTTLTSSADSLTVQSSGGNVVVALTGTGGTAPSAILSATPNPLAFGGMPLNTTTERLVTIANLGATALTINATTSPAAPFGALGLPAGGTVLAAGASVTATITFTPTSATAATGSLVVQSSAGTVTVTLTGSGVLAQPVPSPIAGGWQLNGSASIVGSSLQLTPAQQFQHGSAFWPTAVSSASLTIDFDATITGGNGADGMTMALINPAAGATALGNIGGALGWSPIGGVAVTMDTYQNGNDPSPNFVGIATGYTGTPDTLVYAATNTAVPNLQQGSHHFTVATGGGRLTVRIDGTLYLDAAVTLPDSVLVGFTGGTGGLTNQHMVSNVAILAGDASRAAIPSVTPDPVDFGAVAVSTTASRTITITNAGNMDMTITAITSPASPFGVSDLPVNGSVVAAGQSVTLTVTFAPTAAGVASDTLVIHTDAGTVIVTLTGAGG